MKCPGATIFKSLFFLVLLFSLTPVVVASDGLKRETKLQTFAGKGATSHSTESDSATVLDYSDQATSFADNQSEGRYQIVSESIPASTNPSSDNYNENDEKSAEVDSPPIDNTQALVTIFTEGFEGAFPGSWIVFDGDGATNGEVFWSDTSYRSESGSWSASAADGGADSASPGGVYPHNMQAWMIYGPFSLSDAVGGELAFSYWLDSESGYDFFNFYVSIDGSSFNGYQTSGNSGGWQSASIDFTSVPNLGDVTGDSSVWIGFKFDSDSSVATGEGAYVDNVVVTKTTEDLVVDLEIPTIAVSPNPVTLDQSFSITATVNNVGTDSVTSREIQYYLSTDDVVTTADCYLGNDYVTLAAGASGTEQIILNPLSDIGCVSAGTHYLGIRIPDEAEFWVRSGTIEINNAPVADLEIPNIAVNLNPVALDESFSITATVNNVGDGSVTSREIEYYFSSDDVITTGDCYLGNDFVTLAAGASGSEQIIIDPLSFVGCVSAGTYYLGIRIPDEAESWVRSGTVEVTEGGSCTDDGLENVGSDNTDDTCYGASLALATPQTHLHCDEDWVWFNPVAGATYEIETSNLIGGSDTTLALHELCGAQLEFDDDGGSEAYASRIVWTAQSDDTIDLRVRQFDDSYVDGEGYDITVTCIADCSGGEPEISISPTTLTFTESSGPDEPEQAEDQRSGVEASPTNPYQELFTVQQPIEISSIQGAVAGRQIELEWEMVTSIPEVLGFELLDGLVYEAHMTDYDNRDSGGLSWIGRLQPGDGRVILTVKDGRIVGTIYGPDALYEIRPLPAGGHVLVEIDESLLPACGGGVEPPASSLDGPGDRVPSSPVGNDSGDSIDVMVVYTPQARDAAGGVASIELEIQNAVDSANLAFADSDMIARFNLVHTALANYNDSGDGEDDLVWVRNDATVAALRNQYGADMVSLITEDGGGVCGIGYIMRTPGADFEDLAFQMTDRGCFPGLTWAHEHGHNMGFEHDPDNGGPPDSASYPWSYGHFVDGSYRTVMSYVDPCTVFCPRAPHFSNPDVSHLGAPTGIANQRDNHRSGNLVADIIANFRQNNGAGSNQTFTIFNTGTADLNVDALALETSAPWITWAPQSSFVVAPGGSRAVTVSVDYSLAPSGQSTRRLLVTSNDSDESPYPGGINIEVNTNGGAIPAAPATPSASDGTYPDKVRVSWSSVNLATYYFVVRCTTTSTSSCGSGVQDNASPYDDTTVTPGTTYYFRVIACNDVGCSGYSNYDSGYASTTPCYSLTRQHTGQGSDPTASPTSSTSCSNGEYVVGESITLTASPSAGWVVDSWAGTNNNSSTSTTNSLTMPGSNATVTVNYVQDSTDDTHPADMNEDWTMAINEVTAYGAAWKTGATWPNPPNPIDINYVTNAGFIWKTGEIYHYDGSQSPPWVPGAAPDADQVFSAVGGTAVSVISPKQYTPDQPVSVSITVTPEGGVSSQAIEDQVPSGWTVSAISDSGSFDAVNNKVKWGPFFDDTARELTYTITPPENATGLHSFSGQASFDGYGVTIAGDRMVSDDDQIETLIFKDDFEGEQTSP